MKTAHPIVTALVLAAGLGCHPGDTRGTNSDLDDVMVGTWLVDETLDVVKFHRGQQAEPGFFEHPASSRLRGNAWRRETYSLISIDDEIYGPETVQVTRSSDDNSVLLVWRSAAGPEQATLVRVLDAGVSP